MIKLIRAAIAVTAIGGDEIRERSSHGTATRRRLDIGLWRCDGRCVRSGHLLRLALAMAMLVGTLVSCQVIFPTYEEGSDAGPPREAGPLSVPCWDTYCLPRYAENCCQANNAGSCATKCDVPIRCHDDLQCDAGNINANLCCVHTSSDANASNNCVAANHCRWHFCVPDAGTCPTGTRCVPTSVSANVETIYPPGYFVCADAGGD